MLRNSLNCTKFKHILRHSNEFEIICRNQTSHPNKSSKNYLTLGLIGTVTAGVGGTLLYAKFDDNFRKNIQTSLLLTKKFFNELFKNTQNDQIKDFPPKEKTEESLLKFKKKINKIESEKKEKLDIDTLNSTKVANKVVKSVNIEKPTVEEKIDKTNEVLVKSQFGIENSKLIENLEKPLAALTPTPLLINYDSKNEKKSKDRLSSDDESGNNFTSDITLDKQRLELELEYQKKLAVMKEEYENELKQQVKRLMAAHFDHLADELDLQRKELERELNLVQEDKIIAIKREYQTQIGNSLNQLDKIEKTLKARERLDEDEIKARHLWLLCQSVKEFLKCTGFQKPTPLKEKLTSLTNIVNSMEGQNSLTLSVLKTIPKSALEEGVYNEDSLVERFKKVEKICKRVALVGDEAGTFFRYFLSYLQSALLFETVNIPDYELDESKTVDPSKWNTFDILARVKYCLNKRDLELSLRYANQLKGEARKVAKDWIKDTRVHLEVKQATDLIQAQATSITLQSVK